MIDKQALIDTVNEQMDNLKSGIDTLEVIDFKDLAGKLNKATDNLISIDREPTVELDPVLNRWILEHVCDLPLDVHIAKKAAFVGMSRVYSRVRANKLESRYKLDGRYYGVSLYVRIYSPLTIEEENLLAFCNLS